MKNLQGEKIAEYDYNYTYQKTQITHKIEEFFEPQRGIRLVLLRKETRKGDNFVRLPSSLWVTCEGYPPLSTDAALKSVSGEDLTLFFAGLPTVRSDEHVKIFDEYLKEKLAPLGLDYDKQSKLLKETPLGNDVRITGFIYMKKDVLDEQMAPQFLDIVCDAHGHVLNSEPHACPVDEWRQMIIGKQAITEYHMFKQWGFDVPLSGQRAFFTMIMDKREPEETEDAGAQATQKVLSQESP
jgi:hypothetical protein